MKTWKEELAKVLKGKSDSACAEAFAKFCGKHAESLPLPGQDKEFDQAMWAASEHSKLSGSDERILKRVTAKLLGEKSVAPVAAAALKLKDLIGSGKEAAIATWQDMLSAMAWQQMVPAGALRGVGTQMISLGTFQQDVGEVSVQVNIGWMVDKDDLRVLVQAKDRKDVGCTDVELRINELQRGIIYSRTTNEDGAVVASNVHVGPGQYKVQIVRGDSVVETPYFIV
jgi:hypothetical protein